MDYLVVYTSNTGNTEKVAMKIFDSIPGRSKDIQRLEELRDGEADTYFVGFWNDRGTCGSHSENASFEQSATVNTGHIILLGFVSRLLLSGYVNSRFRRYVRIPQKRTIAIPNCLPDY